MEWPRARPVTRVWMRSIARERPVPVISPQRQRDRHDAILQAAVAVFGERGYEAASIGEIARRAGVSDGLVYRYFENKRDLLGSVLTQFYERTMADIERVVAEEHGFKAELRALVGRHLEAFVEDTALCRLFISEVRVSTDYVGSAVQALNRRYTTILMRIVERGIAAGEVEQGTDLRLVRDLLFGAIEHIAWRHVVRGRRLDVDGVADRLVEMVLGGIAARPKPRRRA